MLNKKNTTQRFIIRKLCTCIQSFALAYKVLQMMKTRGNLEFHLQSFPKPVMLPIYNKKINFWTSYDIAFLKKNCNYHSLLIIYGEWFCLAKKFGFESPRCSDTPRFTVNLFLKVKVCLDTVFFLSKSMDNVFSLKFSS